MSEEPSARESERERERQKLATEQPLVVLLQDDVVAPGRSVSEEPSERGRKREREREREREKETEKDLARERERKHIDRRNLEEIYIYTI